MRTVRDPDVVYTRRWYILGVLNHFWFGSVFFINVPIIAVALAAGAFIVPSSRDPLHRSLDVVGSLLSILGLGSLVYALIQAPDRGWSDGAILAGFGIAAVLLALFVGGERR